MPAKLVDVSEPMMPLVTENSSREVRLNIKLLGIPEMKGRTTAVFSIFNQEFN